MYYSTRGIRGEKKIKFENCSHELDRYRTYYCIRWSGSTGAHLSSARRCSCCRRTSAVRPAAGCTAACSITWTCRTCVVPRNRARTLTTAKATAARTARATTAHGGCAAASACATRTAAAARTDVWSTRTSQKPPPKNTIQIYSGTNKMIILTFWACDSYCYY